MQGVQIHLSGKRLSHNYPLTMQSVQYGSNYPMGLDRQQFKFKHNPIQKVTPEQEPTMRAMSKCTIQGLIKIS